jgi:hypothetical protein
MLEDLPTLTCAAAGRTTALAVAAALASKKPRRVAHRWAATGKLGSAGDFKSQSKHIAQ